MNPTENPKPQDGERDTVADRNVEQLLSRAYQPLVPDAEFVERVENSLVAAARRSAETTSALPDRSPDESLPRITWQSLAGWAAMSCLILAVAYLGMLSRSERGEMRGADPPVVRTDEGVEVGPRDEIIGKKGLVPRPRPAAPEPTVATVGTRIETRVGERRRIALPDGSVIYVNENAKLSLDARRQISVDQGEVFLEVARRPEQTPGPSGPDKLRPAATFLIRTPHRNVTALGTKFAVRVEKAGTDVLVTQGKVAVSGIAAPILSGQQLRTADGGGEPRVAAAPRTSHLLDWTRDLMIAAESPLVPNSNFDGGALVAVDPDGQELRLSLRKYHIDVHIEDGYARTTIDQTYFNHKRHRLEGTFYFPLPPDASLSRLAMYVAGKLMEGGMAERDYARQVFETIKYRQLDPALLEWIDGSTFKMRVFPLEGRQEKRIILSYTQKLDSLYGRTRYRFPAGHSMKEVGRWSVRVHVSESANLTWECPSHELAAEHRQGDLVLTAAAERVKPDRDLVLELRDATPRPAGRDSARFSTALHEGAQYLSLRYRPELSLAPQPQRRDWVFLCESSADRDPLLARVQVDVIRTLLENAEHDDTFTLLTAATRVRALSDGPLPVTPHEVAAATRFLDGMHLIGAFDFEQALSAAVGAADKVERPVIVHLGSGVPVLGERRGDRLLGLLPKDVPYVGVGVGKRFNRHFMNAAAGRTGGYFTQINPDEPVGWRAFELLSTLNTPRLLDVKVTAGDAAQDAVSLHLVRNVLVHGEELCAIGRFDSAAELPRTVTVTGTLAGASFSCALPVQDAVPGAGYLPRIWAKLEIDRLLAENAEQNKDRIITLSKAMYVMSPYTSLLVLENDQMYEQYKVDRGRKDHWALYNCPEQIEVVHEPLAGPAPASEAEQSEAESGEYADSSEEASKPSPGAVMRRILVHIPPPMFKGRAGATWGGTTRNVWQLLRGNYGDRCGTAPRRWITVNTTVSVPDGGTVVIGGRRFELVLSEALAMHDRRTGLVNINTIGSGSLFPLFRTMFGGAGYGKHGRPDLSNTAFLIDAMSRGERFDDPYEYDMPIWELSADSPRAATAAFDAVLRYHDAWSDGPWYLWDIDNDRDGMPDAWGSTGVGGSSQADFETLIKLIESTIAPTTWTDAGGNGSIEGFPGNLSLVISQTQEVHEDPFTGWRYVPEWPGDTTVTGWQIAAFPYLEETLDYDAALYDPAPWAWDGLDLRRWKYSTVDLPWSRRGVGYGPADSVLHVFADSHVEVLSEEIDPFVYYAMVAGGGRSARLGLDQYRVPQGSMFLELHPTGEVGRPARPDSPQTQGRLARAIAAVVGQRREEPDLLYHPPEFSEDERVFQDLVAYAPGMNTAPADVLAAIDQDARCDNRPRPGKVDERARELIEGSRRRGWQSVTWQEGGPSRPAFTVQANGSGHYRYQRLTAHGLSETVACDGETLWHVYPELGLGAERKFSQFHRGEILSLVPWLLPPVDEMALGADLRAVGPQTVAVVPHGVEEFCRQLGELKRELESSREPDAEGGPAPTAEKSEVQPIPYVLMHLVFDPAGRLVERRFVEMPSQKTVLTVAYAPEGAIRCTGRDGKLLCEYEIEVHDIDPPELTPDSRQLVLLPMPRQTGLWAEVSVLKRVAKSDDWRDEKIDFATLSEADALQLVAAHLHINYARLQDLIEKRFFQRGDHRIGFYTLLLSSVPPETEMELSNLNLPDLKPPTEGGPITLARYIAWQLSKRARREIEVPRWDEQADGFLAQLVAVQQLYASIQDGSIAKQKGRESDDPFAERRADTPSWDRFFAFVEQCKSPTFAFILLRAVDDHARRNGALNRRLILAYHRLEQRGAKGYAVRYEHCRALGRAYRGREEYERFTELYQDVLEAGGLPAIDVAFRRAFEGTTEGRRAWDELMFQTCDRLTAKRRYAEAIVLAWQCRQLREPNLARSLLLRILDAVEPEDRFPVTLLAVGYLACSQQHREAEKLLELLLDDERYGELPALWQLAGCLADLQGKLARSVTCQETALELALSQVSGKVEVAAIRKSHGSLLSRYGQLANALATLDDQASARLISRVVHVADRWRTIDDQVHRPCRAAAKVLYTLGAERLAWDYLTTPLALKPNQAAPWRELAETLRDEGQFEMADRAYAAAFEAEPTDAELLWERAQLLKQTGRPDEANRLYKQLAESEWQPRFEYLRQRAARLLRE